MATMLSKEAFDASRQFIESNARHLEIARFQYHFDGASNGPIIAALTEFQNADGGFGHALEPDLRASDVFRSVRALYDDSVSSSIDYLLDTLDRKIGHWRIIPQSAEESPHAPWWNQTDREDVFDCFSLNPTAEILGYLYDYQQHVPSGIISLVSDRVTSHLSDLEKIEMHELLCCLRLLQTDNLPENVRGLIQRTLSCLVDGTVARDPTQWEGYSLRPLQVADDPDSPFMASIEGPVAVNLDYEISSQNDDGSWTPTWSWGDAFPNEWMLACREWTGIVTLEKLLLLQRFKRIEEIA